jgi:hypothetical protein
MAALEVGQAAVGFGDAIMLDRASEEAFISNLKIRFENGRIYTYIGEVRRALCPGGMQRDASLKTPTLFFLTTELIAGLGPEPVSSSLKPDIRWSSR